MPKTSKRILPQSQMRKLLLLTFSASSLLTLAGCETLTKTFDGIDGLFAAAPAADAHDPAKVVCETMRPIAWSKSDTDQTIFQVKTHNRVLKELCPNMPVKYWGPPILTPEEKKGIEPTLKAG